MDAPSLENVVLSKFGKSIDVFYNYVNLVQEVKHNFPSGPDNV